MKSKRYIQKTKMVFFIQVFTCIAFSFLNVAVHAQTESLVVICNDKGAPGELKFSDLKSIFLGERQRWHNGDKISIALMKTNTAVGTNTCKRVYDMSSDEVKKFWLALVFQGKADTPEFFNTIEELEHFVADNPGAIGIINQPPSSADIRIVLINGKKAI